MRSTQIRRTTKKRRERQQRRRRQKDNKKQRRRRRTKKHNNTIRRRWRRQRRIRTKHIIIIPRITAQANRRRRRRRYVRRNTLFCFCLFCTYRASTTGVKLYPIVIKLSNSSNATPSTFQSLQCQTLVLPIAKCVRVRTIACSMVWMRAALNGWSLNTLLEMLEQQLTFKLSNVKLSNARGSGIIILSAHMPWLIWGSLC